MADSEHLAVYGLLRSAHPTLGQLGVDDRVRLVGPCRFAGTLLDAGAYPGVRLRGEATVVGELLEVLDPSVWPVLDTFEGPEYRRVRVTCHEPVGVQAWVYEVMPGVGDAWPVVPTGLWPPR